MTRPSHPAPAQIFAPAAPTHAHSHHQIVVVAERDEPEPRSELVPLLAIIALVAAVVWKLSLHCVAVWQIAL